MRYEVPGSAANRVKLALSLQLSPHFFVVIGVIESQDLLIFCRTGDIFVPVVHTLGEGCTCQNPLPGPWVQRVTFEVLVEILICGLAEDAVQIFSLLQHSKWVRLEREG